MVGTLSGGVQNGRGGDRGRVAEIEGGLAQEASMEFPHYLIKKSFNCYTICFRFSIDFVFIITLSSFYLLWNY